MLEVRIPIKARTLLAALVFTIVTAHVSYLVSGYTEDDLQLLEDALESGDLQAPPYYPSAEKRYARLSYNYGNYGNNRHNTYYNRRMYNRQYYRNYYKPWMNLPDTECFRKRCGQDADCCRRFSKCDKSAHICTNCWYGHPCETSRDCCQQFPFCNRQSGFCQ